VGEEGEEARHDYTIFAYLKTAFNLGSLGGSTCTLQRGVKALDDYYSRRKREAMEEGLVHVSDER